MSVPSQHLLTCLRGEIQKKIRQGLKASATASVQSITNLIKDFVLICSCLVKIFWWGQDLWMNMYFSFFKVIVFKHNFRELAGAGQP